MWGLLVLTVPAVQVDCQAGVGLVPSQGGGPTSALASHTALEQSVADHFPGNHIINCMCHSTENFYRCGQRISNLPMPGSCGTASRRRCFTPTQTHQSPAVP